MPVIHHNAVFNGFQLGDNKAIQYILLLTCNDNDIISFSFPHNNLTEFFTRSLLSLAISKELPPTLRFCVSLDLSANKIGDFGCISLFSLLPHLNMLKNLSLMGNDISSKALIASSSSHLVECKYLQKLDLSMNKIDDDGVIALARNIINISLTSNLFPLYSLDLGRNEITEKGLKSLVFSLRYSSITSLNLFGNNIRGSSYNIMIATTNTSINGFHDLCDSITLRTNHLLDVNLSANSLDNDDIEKLGNCLETCGISNLMSVDLIYNQGNVTEEVSDKIITLTSRSAFTPQSLTLTDTDIVADNTNSIPSSSTSPFKPTFITVNINNNTPIFNRNLIINMSNSSSFQLFNQISQHTTILQRNSVETITIFLSNNHNPAIISHFLLLFPYTRVIKLIITR